MAPAPTPTVDAWPQTKRRGPWLVGVLLFVILVVPFDGVTLNIPSPVDAELDRVILAGLFGWWIVRRLWDGPSRETPHRLGAPELWLIAFGLFCVLSLTLNYHVLELTGNAERTVKQLATVASLIALYAFVVGNVRAADLPRLVTLVLGLACIAALGTILEWATKFNIFYSSASLLLDRVAQVRPTDGVRIIASRANITGPTHHGLAVATMLSIAFPFAVVRCLDRERETRERWRYAGVAILLFLGALLTLRRSGIILPTAAMITIAFGSGQRGIKLLFGSVLIVGIIALSLPKVRTQSIDQLTGKNAQAEQSTKGRSDDFRSTWPDIKHRALYGSGFSPQRIGQILDDQYLGLTVGLGFTGLAIYLGLILTMLWRALVLYRRGPPEVRELALAALAAFVVYFVANGLFDALAFSQAPYLFLIVSAFVNCVWTERGFPWAAHANRPLRVTPPAPA